jgi:hypothetical protein
MGNPYRKMFNKFGKSLFQGVRGVMEYSISSTAAGNFAAARFRAECPSGDTIPANKVAAAIEICAEDLSGTHTGQAAMINAPNPTAGTYDFFASFGSATGVIAAKSSNLSSLAASHRIAVNFNGTTIYIPCVTTWA